MTATARPLPLADARSVFPAAPRTRALRIGLALVVLALALASTIAARGTDARATSYFAEGASGVVVADLSASINPAAFQRTARVLRTLAETGQRVGLVAFSDTAYEMLPLGTSGEELRPLLRFFEPENPAPGALPLLPGDVSSPWTEAFVGGTRISTGLAVAREMLAREGSGRGSVLLVSDLNDATSDLPLVTRELQRYRRQGIELRIVPLFPTEEHLALFTQLAGRGAFLQREELVENSRVAERRTLVAEFPLVLVVAAGLLLLVLAANEYACRRLDWRQV